MANRILDRSSEAVSKLYTSFEHYIGGKRKSEAEESKYLFRV